MLPLQFDLHKAIMLVMAHRHLVRLQLHDFVERAQEETLHVSMMIAADGLHACCFDMLTNCLCCMLGT